MSKQMTREEAVQAILDAVTELGRWSVPNDVEEAIAILAPEPRTEKPGVEGVLLCIDTDYAGGTWDITVRAKLQEPCLLLKSGMPCSIALPMPKGGA